MAPKTRNTAKQAPRTSRAERPVAGKTPARELSNKSTSRPPAKGAMTQRVPAKRARPAAPAKRARAAVPARAAADRKARTPAAGAQHLAAVREVLATVAGAERITVGDLAKRLAVTNQAVLKTLRDAVDGLLAQGAATTITKTDTLAPELWGKTPSTARVAAARRHSEALRREALSQALDGALTRSEVADRLHITPQAVSKRMTAGQLVAVKYAGKPRFPLWQFSDDDVVDGLDTLLEAFPSTVVLSSWATTPSPDLDGQTPADALQRPRGPARVFELLESTSPEAW